MIAMIDYGVGNLFSLQSSFRAVGAEVTVTSEPDVIRAASHVVLPGVGAFGDAAQKLVQSGLRDVVLTEAESGKPFLGICLGMQLLFDRSFEFGEHEGLHLIPGTVRAIREVIPETLPVPHMGWNALSFRHKDEKGSLSGNLKEGDHVYFVHSYAAFDCDDFVSATCEYGAVLTAAVRRENIYGVQFHPEKSGTVGLEMLRAFAAL